MNKYCKVDEVEKWLNCGEDCISREWIIKHIGEINLLYNEISRFQCLLDNAIEKHNKGALRIGKWIADRYCSECEWDKKEATYTSGLRENFCPNCGAKMKRGNDE